MSAAHIKRTSWHDLTCHTPALPDVSVSASPCSIRPVTAAARDTSFFLCKQLFFCAFVPCELCKIKSVQWPQQPKLAVSCTAKSSQGTHSLHIVVPLAPGVVSSPPCRLPIPQLHCRQFFEVTAKLLNVTRKNEIRIKSLKGREKRIILCILELVLGNA